MYNDWSAGQGHGQFFHSTKMCPASRASDAGLHTYIGILIRAALQIDTKHANGPGFQGSQIKQKGQKHCVSAFSIIKSACVEEGFAQAPWCAAVAPQS